MVLLLARSDLESVLTMKDVMEAVEEGFRQYGIGTVEMPIRSSIRIGKYDGTMLYMPAYIGGMDALAVKIVSVYPNNPVKYGFPTISGTVLLNDPKTGALLSVMDGAFITAMRTGAVGGIAAKYLARNDSKVVGIFGCGVQARAQLLAVSEVRSLEKVKAYDAIPENCKRFCGEMSSKLGIEVIPTDNPEKVVQGSDIIVTVTTSKEPVFKGEWLGSGTHINGIGSHHGPGIREIDEITVKKAKVVVDSREACLKEAGDLIDPIKMGVISVDHIHAELSEIILGTKSGRTSNGEITLFKSVGLALQDSSTAIKAYNVAKNLGIGKTVAF
jgi:ornithine cyclodeaminase/alanine dehydrogenase